jgi:hypothetical protein
LLNFILYTEKFRLAIHKMYNLAKKFAVPVSGRVRFGKQAAGKQLLLRRVETLVW